MYNFTLIESSETIHGLLTPSLWVELYLEDVHGDAGARLPELQEIRVAKELSLLIPVPRHCREVASLPAPLHGHVGELLVGGATGC